MSRLTAYSYRTSTPMGGEVTETTDDIALGIRRDVENVLHQAGADQNVIDERHRIMAEIFPADTNTEAKNAVYKFACEAMMNLMRAEVLAVVGMTKTDLRASLADENIEIETLFDPALGITEKMFEPIELVMAGEITAIVTVAENHMTENVMPLIDDMLSSRLTELATVSSSSKVKSRQEEEAAAQKEILRHFDLRHAEYIKAAQTIHQLKVNIAALTAKLNENMLVSASQDMDGKDLKDIIGDDLEEASIQSKVMDKVKTLQKMESDATDEAIHLASGYANVIMAKKQAPMLDAQKLKWNRSLANTTKVDPAQLADFHETIRNLESSYGKDIHSVVMHLEVTMMQFLSFDEMSKQRPPGQHNNYDGIPHDLRDQFIFHNETLFSILRNMMREDINYFLRLRKTQEPDIESRGFTGDGLSVIFALCHVNSTTGPMHKTHLEEYFSSCYAWFAKGNPIKTIDRIRPVLEKALKLNVRVPWYSVTRLIVDTLIKRSFTTYTELKAMWLKPTSEDFSLNALPQLDSVFADIVNMTEEANTYPAELKGRDYTRAEARMVIVCDEDKEYQEAVALITPVRPPRPAMPKRPSKPGAPTKTPKCAAIKQGSQCDNHLSELDWEFAQKRNAKAKANGRKPDKAVCRACYDFMNKTGKTLTLIDGSTKAPFVRKKPPIKAKAYVTKPKPVSTKVLETLVEDANSDKEDQSFREGLAQKLLETNKTKAKANFAHCFIKGKNDVLLGDKANGAGPRTPFAQAAMETADEPPDTCSICFEDVGKEDPKLLCKHAFHMACLMEWAASETSRAHETISCPNCRGPTFTKDPGGIVGEQVGPWWTAAHLVDALDNTELTKKSVHKQNIRLQNVDKSQTPNLHLNHYNDTVQGLETIHQMCLIDEKCGNNDLLLSTILREYETCQPKLQQFSLTETPEDGTMTWCTHSMMANAAHVLPTQIASKCDVCKDFPHAGYMETHDEDPNDQWRPNRLKVCITQDWFNKIDLTNQFARRIRLVIKCYFSDMAQCFRFSQAHLEMLTTFIRVDDWLQQRDFLGNTDQERMESKQLTQARQMSMILTMAALVIPQHLAGRGNGINIPFPENTRPGGQINRVPTIGDPHYDDYCDFVKATFCPVRGVVLPDMYLSRLLNKRFTTAKLEAASCGDLMKIFSENDETQKHPMIYNGPPVICFICQRMMAQMTPAQRREIGLPEAPPSVNMSESTIQFNETTEALARQCAFSEVGENARLIDTAQMQKLWNSSGIRREYKVGSPIHAYRQYGPKQDSIVWFVAQNTIQWNWVECFEGYSDDVPSHTAYQQDGYQDWFDNPQPSVRPSGCEAQMGILHFTFVKKTYFLHEGAKINRQLMKKGPSTYFHSHLVDGQDVTNKISRQYGYPANHCDVGSNTAIIHGRFYPGVTEWPLEMSPIQHAEDHIDLLFSCKVKDTVGIWGFHPIVDTPKRFGVNAAPDPGTTQNAWGSLRGVLPRSASRGWGVHGLLPSARDAHSENWLRNGVWDGRKALAALEMHKTFILDQLQEGCSIDANRMYVDTRQVGTSNAFLRRLPKGAFWNLPTKQEEDDQTGDFASPAHTALEVVGKQVQKLQQSAQVAPCDPIQPMKCPDLLDPNPGAGMHDILSEEHCWKSSTAWVLLGSDGQRFKVDANGICRSAVLFNYELPRYFPNGPPWKLTSPTMMVSNSNGNVQSKQTKMSVRSYSAQFSVGIYSKTFYNLSCQPFFGNVSGAASEIKCTIHAPNKIYPARFEQLFIAATINWMKKAGLASEIDSICEITDYERISSPSTLHAAARLAFLAFCMVQIDIYTGKTQLLDSNIKIVDAQDTAGIASGTRLLASTAELETGSFMPQTHYLPVALMTVTQLDEHIRQQFGEGAQSAGPEAKKHKSDLYGGNFPDNIGLGKGIHPKDETQDAEACRFVSPPIVGINKKCRDRHQRMLENVNENAERKELYDWLQQQGCTDMYGVIVDEGFEKLEDFITGGITTADMQELADAAREGEGHSRAMSFDDSTFRARLCQTLADLNKPQPLGPSYLHTPPVATTAATTTTSANARVVVCHKHPCMQNGTALRAKTMLPTMSPILTNQEPRVGANDTVIITFVLDGGATHLLTGTCYSDLLHGAMPSNMTVTGFNSNDAPLQGEMFGTVYMHAVGIENEDAVGAYKMSMTTVPGLAFNLFPERSLYEQGYIISKDINGDSSMTKYDSAGVVVHRIPIFYDAENAHHVIHMAVSRTKNTEQLTKLVHKTSATVQNMYASPPKSRGYDEDDDSKIQHEFKSEKMMQEKFDFENAIARRAQEATEAPSPAPVTDEATAAPASAAPATISTQTKTTPVDTTSGGTQPTPEEIDEGWVEIEKENTLGSAKNAFPGGRQMTSLEAHKAKNHVGFHPQCDECKRVRATQTRVFKKAEQVHETRVGHTWSIDTWTTDAEDYKGRRYCTVCRDHKSGYFKLIYSSRRSELPQQIKDMIVDMRIDSLFDNFDYEIASEIHLDLAGEFAPESKEFQQVAHELGIQLKYASPHDKRTNNHAENAVKVIEIKTKASMATFNTPVQWWSHVATSVATILNLTAMTKNIVSRDQDAIRPLEEISNGKISRTECDKRVAAHTVPGTPCLVQLPHGPKASSITNYSRSRNGIAVDMLGNLTIFEDPEDPSIHFKSRGFTILKMLGHRDAWDLFKAKSAYTDYVMNNDAYAQLPMDKIVEFRPFTKHVHIEENASDELQWDFCTRNGLSIEGDPKGDKEDRDLKNAKWEMKKAKRRGLKKTTQSQKSKKAGSSSDTDQVVTEKANRLAQQLSTQTKIMALSSPKQCKGWTVFKNWKGFGVCKGTVTKAVKIKDPNTQKVVQGWEVLWEADGETSDFDRGDMINFAINKIHGDTATTTAPAEKSMKPTRANEEKRLMQAKNELFDTMPNYVTKNNDHFIKICDNIGVKPQERKFYLQWLEEEHNIGRKPLRQKVGEEPKDRVHQIKDPFNHGKQTRFSAGVKIPTPHGCSKYLSLIGHHKKASDIGNRQKLLEEEAHAYMVKMIDGFKLHHRDRDTSMAEHDYAVATLATEIVNEWSANTDSVQPEQCDGSTALGAQSKALAALKSTLELTTGPTKEQRATEPGAEYAKHDNPKDMKAARMRSDSKAWEKAAESEMKSIADHDVLSRDFTLKELQEMGIYRKPIGCRFVLERKYKGDVYERHKARMVCQGHRGYLMPGRDFEDTYAPTPNHASTRLMQALSLMPHPVNKKKFTRMCWDVSTAYLCAKLPMDKAEDIMVIRMPVGMRKFRDPKKPREATHLKHEKPWVEDNENTEGLLDEGKASDETYFCLKRALYGLPVSSKHWYKELKTWVMKTFSKSGWTCKNSKAEPSMFIVKSPRNDYSYMNCHSDDIELLTTSPTDGGEIIEKFQQQYGVKMADSSYMLGLNRDEIIVNGVKTIQVTQEAYITELYEAFKDQMPSYTPKTPFPETIFLSLSTPDGKRKETDQSEIDEVYEKGYMKAVGGLLWSARCTAPQTTLGINYLQRVMSQPTHEAFKAAMHMIKYLYENRHQGICFNENGEKTLRVYYDSSNKADYTDGKAQYGFVGMFMGGPIFWASRKHRHVGTSSTANEYMALKHAVVETVWIRDLLTEMELGDLIKGPTIMLGDNDQATSLAYEDRVTGGNKMIKQDYHYSKEQLEEGIIDTRRVATLDNYSDMFTKALSRQYMENLLPTISGYAMKPLPAVPKPRSAF